MNGHEARLYVLVVAHVAVWLFVIFGGLYSCRVAAFNMLVALPLVYVVQSSLKTHVFIKAKTDLILRHPEAFQPDADYVFTERELAGIAHDARETGRDPRAVEFARRVMVRYEDALVLPRLRRAVDRACQRNFQVPGSAQGMLVLAYIANAAIYALRCRGGCG